MKGPCEVEKPLARFIIVIQNYCIIVSFTGEQLRDGEGLKHATEPIRDLWCLVDTIQL